MSVWRLAKNLDYQPSDLWLVVEWLMPEKRSTAS